MISITVISTILMLAPPQGYVPITGRPTPQISPIPVPGEMNVQRSHGDHVNRMLTGYLEIADKKNAVDLDDVKLQVIIERLSTGNIPTGEKITFDLNYAGPGATKLEPGEFKWRGIGGQYEHVRTTAIEYLTTPAVLIYGDQYRVTFTSRSSKTSGQPYSEQDGILTVNR